MQIFQIVLLCLCSVLTCSAIKCYVGVSDITPAGVLLNRNMEKECPKGDTACTKVMTTAPYVEATNYWCGSALANFDDPNSVIVGCQNFSSTAVGAIQMICVCQTDLCNGRSGAMKVISARSAMTGFIMLMLLKLSNND